MTLGEQIKKARKEAKMGQRQVADVLGVTASVVSRYESGEIVPSADKLEKMAIMFKTRFFTKEKPKEKELLQIARYTIWKDNWPIGTINLYPWQADQANANNKNVYFAPAREEEEK